MCVGINLFDWLFNSIETTNRPVIIKNSFRQRSQTLRSRLLTWWSWPRHHLTVPRLYIYTLLVYIEEIVWGFVRWEIQDAILLLFCESDCSGGKGWRQGDRATVWIIHEQRVLHSETLPGHLHVLPARMSYITCLPGVHGGQKLPSDTWIWS